MYEVKSCGVTLDLTRDHMSALNCFANACGAHVVLYKFNEAGRKYLVNQKYSYHSIKKSK